MCPRAGIKVMMVGVERRGGESVRASGRKPRAGRARRGRAPPVPRGSLTARLAFAQRTQQGKRHHHEIVSDTKKNRILLATYKGSGRNQRLEE